MTFQNAPPAATDSHPKIAVVLVNLGTPDAPTPAAVRRYLKPFLSDRRVVDAPRWIWWFVLNLFILPFRARKSARKYASIWTREGSPLLVHSEKQAKLLRGFLGERKHDVQVVLAMRYGTPSLLGVLDRLKREGCERILILPAYPQYCGATTASVFDVVTAYYAREKNIPELRFVKNFDEHEGYIGALAESVLAHWEANGRSEKLVMSFHGIRKRSQKQGDPYPDECQATARLLAERLGLTPEQYVVTFQSRFGRAEWLQPYTAQTLQKLAREGVQRVDVICPGFVADCLETLEEIAIEARQDFLTAGGKEFHYIPCLNESNTWMHALAEIAEQHLLGWPTMMSTVVQEQQREQARLLQARARLLGTLK
jgi:protoporphyrin/coproporphyrin ferrochelatase